ncbi:DUF4442 domain-containing protein [Salinisphaera orenii]|uniref:DUF4442 domain-containing protein n=1 Tax=Salinisphaera orenii TaxID=856731 RepID=UPI003CCC593A
MWFVSDVTCPADRAVGACSEAAVPARTLRRRGAVTRAHIDAQAPAAAQPRPGHACHRPLQSAEAAAGVLTEATVPAPHRWRPKGMTLDDRARTGSDPTATPGRSWRGGGLRRAAGVAVIDRSGHYRHAGLTPRRRRERRHSTRVTVCPLARSRSTRPRGPTR